MTDIRLVEEVRGRSINLALSVRGRSALREIGLEDVLIKDHGIPMRGRMIHGKNGSLTEIPYDPVKKNVNWRYIYIYFLFIFITIFYLSRPIKCSIKLIVLFILIFFLNYFSASIRWIEDSWTRLCSMVSEIYIYTVMIN